jgi:FlaG/FlaF family flagellin (archaellin)
MKAKRANRAISDVVATILLLGITVALFAVVSLVVLSYPIPESTPEVNIVGYVDNNIITVEHNGGYDLNLNTIIIVFINNTNSYEFTVDELINDVELRENGWNIGEIIKIDTMDIPIGYDITSSLVEITVIDGKSNSIVMTGIIQDQNVWSTINNPPTFGTPTPGDGSTDQPTDFDWEISITDPNLDDITWEIECNNSQTNSGTGESGGTKTLPLSGLSESTTYTVWVNATDPSGSGLWIRDYFTFNTETTILSIETSIDSISPYEQTSSPLTITATGDSGLDSVELWYKWEGTQQMSICDGFETGMMDTSLWDTYQSGGDARIQFNYGTAHSSSYSCAMDDDDTNSDDYSLNELYTVYDFTGASNINIDFWERDYEDSDEQDNPPSNWVDHGNYDAVAFTNDGTTWYTIFDADDLDNNDWEHFTYDVSSHPNFDSNVNGNFAIKFQQYDNYELTYDGRLWDDICITFTAEDSISWALWSDSSNPDATSPWQWSFDFPEGEGYYEFYSIGKKSGYSDELPPSSADASCHYTWATLTYDDFESGWGSYTDGGRDCIRTSDYQHEGSYSINIRDNSGTSSSFYHTSGIDVHTPGYTSIKVDFWWMWRDGWLNGEDWFVEYYDGTSWNTVLEIDYPSSYSEDVWYHETFYINEASYIFPTNMQIRFRCDASGNNDDVYIDEIEISAR